jgi:hypothetical protein
VLPLLFRRLGVRQLIVWSPTLFAFDFFGTTLLLHKVECTHHRGSLHPMVLSDVHGRRPCAGTRRGCIRDAPSTRISPSFSLCNTLYFDPVATLGRLYVTHVCSTTRGTSTPPSHTRIDQIFDALPVPAYCISSIMTWSSSPNGGPPALGQDASSQHVWAVPGNTVSGKVYLS